MTSASFSGSQSGGFSRSSGRTSNSLGTDSRSFNSKSFSKSGSFSNSKSPESRSFSGSESVVINSNSYTNSRTNSNSAYSRSRSDSKSFSRSNTYSNSRSGSYSGTHSYSRTGSHSTYSSRSKSRTSYSRETNSNSSSLSNDSLMDSMNSTDSFESSSSSEKHQQLPAKSEDESEGSGFSSISFSSKKSNSDSSSELSFENSPVLVSDYRSLKKLAIPKLQNQSQESSETSDYDFVISSVEDTVSIGSEFEGDLSEDESGQSNKKAVETFNQSTLSDSNFKTAKYLRDIENEKDKADPYLYFALYLARKGETERAQRYFERALFVDPKHLRALSAYALFLEKIGQYDKAEEQYKKGIVAQIGKKSKTMKMPCIVSNYAVFLKNIRRNSKYSEKLYLRAIKCDTKNVNALGNFGILLWELKELNQAKKLFSRCVNQIQRSKDLKNCVWLKVYSQFLLQEFDDERKFIRYKKCYSKMCKQYHKIHNKSPPNL